MGIPNFKSSTWVSRVVMSRSRYLHVHIQLHAHDWASTMALTSESDFASVPEDAKGLACCSL